MYRMQVKVETSNGTKEWRSVCPTGGQPYEYTIKREAWEMLNMYYPEVVRKKLRVIEVINEQEVTK